MRAIARLQRLVRRRKQKTTTDDNFSGLTSVEERRGAELFLIAESQRGAHLEEISSMKSGTKLKSNSRLCGLDPFLDDDGIVRVGGRLRCSSLSFEVRCPIVIPKDSHITSLIIGHHHAATSHQRRGLTLNEIRLNGMWLMGGVKAVAAHIHRCVKCRRRRGRAAEQKMADLPEDRVEPAPPFTYCGTDCFGPFLVKEGRKTHKRYGLLFTCMSSRAVHIEMLEDMTTDAFLNALRCFIAIRGAVQQLRSDQGTNFVGAKNELKAALQELDAERIKTFLSQRQCNFLMNPPQSSHAGGVWERQIRTIRSILTSIIEDSQGRLDSASLRTFLYESMSIVNSRPLTVDNLNDASSPVPLTPNQLLTMKGRVALPPPGEFVREDVFARKRWRRVQFLAEQFWSRWKVEYLANITRRQKWNTPRRNFEAGDVVIVHEDTARGEWQMARVVEATPGDDGLVRKVKCS